MRICLLFLLALAAIYPQAAHTQEFNRRVLGLYDSTETPVYQCNIPRMLEMPLTRLGLVVDYHDARQRPLPDFSAYRAIAVWFNDSRLNEPEEFLRWLTRAANAGVRIIIIDETGADADDSGRATSAEATEALLAALGLKQGDVPYLSNPFIVKTELLRPDAFGFEIPEPGEPPAYRDYRLAGDGLKPWLEVWREDVADSRAVAVAAGEKGGFISDQQMVAQTISSPIWQLRWYLDPFLFLTEATGTEGSLRPDTTTAFGLRAAFSHIDGDGEMNYTRDMPGKQRVVTEILHEQVLSAYPVPITLSYIAARMLPEGGATPELLETYRKTLALPNITPAAHGYTHPMKWHEGILGLSVPGYTYNARTETVGALQIITNTVCPPDKPARIFLWTGDCLATQDALAALAEFEYLNLNGGDPRYDELYNSISNICAPGIKIGPYRQIYAAASNEYLYTNGWRENFGGFANVTHTFRNTTEPRYLPVNIYFHNYICERQAGVNSIRKVFDWALAQNLCWLTAEEYSRSVLGLYRARWSRSAKDAYHISDYSGLNTVRLDGEARHVEMRGSGTIAGYTHFAGARYISLLPGERATFTLRAEEGELPYIRHSTALLREVRLEERGLTLEARLFPAGFIEIGGLGGRKISAGSADAALPVEGARVLLPQGLGEWLKIRITLE